MDSFPQISIFQSAKNTEVPVRANDTMRLIAVLDEILITPTPAGLARLLVWPHGIPLNIAKVMS
jgi:hypothetical protein